jgi:hypothetical protein
MVLSSGEIKNIYLSINTWTLNEVNTISLIINFSCSHKTSNFHLQINYSGRPLVEAEVSFH